MTLLDFTGNFGKIRQMLFSLNLSKGLGILLITWWISHICTEMVLILFVYIPVDVTTVVWWYFGLFATPFRTTTLHLLLEYLLENKFFKLVL